MKRFPGLVVALLLLLAAVPTHFALAADSSSAFCTQLRNRLLRGGGPSSGLYVIDAQTGSALCARAAGRPRPLASNMKLFTTSTVLSRFGPDARIPTKVLATGTIDGHGVLHGNLYLKGGGDPALGTPAFYDRFLGGVGTNLYDLTRQMRSAGLTGVTGRLYADDEVFDRRRGVADSGYATSPYIGPLSGLSFDSGYTSAAATRFATDPAKVAGSKLLSSLRSSGISIRSGVALGDPGSAHTETIAVVHSPTIDSLVNATDVFSDNFFAEMLIKLLGAEFGGRGSTAAGARVVEQFARSKGTGVHAVDGSGLTRSNRASPAQVVRLLDAMRSSPVGEDLVSDMALAGREGTVADRMHGTAAAGRCRLKTGTLTGVSNLSGYCFNADGKELIFSILMGSAGDIGFAHTEQDLMAASIAAY